MTHLVPRILSCAFFAIALAVIGTTAARALDAADLPTAIENAKTPADHEAIAAYFDAEAKAAHATAAEHRRLSSFYAKHHAPVGKGSGASSPLHQAMPPHCDRLAKDYEAAAKEYEEMAAAHRTEASALK